MNDLFEQPDDATPLMPELMMMSVAIRNAIGIYERANARSGPMS